MDQRFGLLSLTMRTRWVDCCLPISPSLFETDPRQDYEVTVDNSPRHKKAKVKEEYDFTSDA